MYKPPKVRRIRRPKKVKYYPLLPPGPKRKFGSEKLARPSYYSYAVTYRRILFATQTILGSTSVVNNSASNITAGFNQACSFSRNPNWKQQVARGQNATYPYSRNGGTVTPARFASTTYYSKDSTIRWDWYGTLVGPANLDTSADNALKDIALARLKNKLNGYIGSANLLPPLAESRELHGLVRTINSSAMDMLKQMLLIKRTRGKSAVKYAGQLWLTWGFGIAPVISDCAKAAQSIGSYLSRYDRTERITGTASKQWLSQVTDGSSTDPCQGTTVYVKTETEHQLAYRYSGAVQLNLRSAANYDVADHLGLEFGQLPATLWELTPYSWVVDYAATVGPWLDDVFFTLPGVLKYLSFNTRYQAKSVYTPRIQYLNFYFGRNTVLDKGAATFFSFSRESLATLPTRQLRVKTLDEVGKYGLTKILNLASVLAGRLKTPHV